MARSLVVRCFHLLSISVACAALAAHSLPAQQQQQQEDVITRVDLPIGRSFPISTPASITHVSIANPDVADVILIGDREMVVNAKTSGETDAIVWLENASRTHYRISVHSPADRQQIALYIKFAEVRKDFLRDLGSSIQYNNTHVQAGTGNFNALKPDSILASTRFLTLLTDFNTKNLLYFLDVQEQRGRARVLAEPNVMAGNKEEATFLAGGELPIPVVQGGTAGATSNAVTVQYKEFGIRLRFVGEILSDSLIKLSVTPEVSSLDFANAVLLNGFRIPALRTRRVQSTVDVKRDQSLILSGLFDNEVQRVKTGVPLLMNIPIIGQLFASTSFQRNETELIIVVTPVLIDPMHPRSQDVLFFAPDTTRPAHDALESRLPKAPRDSSTSKPPRR